MTTTQPAALHELPEPSLQQGKYGYRLSHEDYYTADQMRARDAMWAERLAALQPKPAAAVSDEEIKRVCGQHGISPRSYVLAFARAILALRPAQQAPLASGAKCQTCNGHGMVGGHMQDGSGYAEGCPDCNPEPAPLVKWARAQQATPEPVGEPTEGEFFAWDAEGGIAFYKARQEAINHAKESLRYYQDKANNHGEWDEDVEHIRWGVVMQRAEATNISATEDGESSCDYELQDVATHPAPGVPDGEPKLTQEELLEVAKHAWLMARTADSLQFYRTLLSAAAQAKGDAHD